MGGSDVEFIDPPDDDPRSGPLPRAPLRHRSDGAAHRVRDEPRRGRSAVAALLLAAAGILCAVAAFQTVFTYRFLGTVLNTHGGYDAMGRSFDSQLISDHGPRYSVPLLGCAALLAVVAVERLSAVRAGSEARTDRRVGALGLVAVGALAGVLTAMVVAVQSEFANYRAVATGLRPNSSGVDLALGPCLWTALAALLCGLAALAVPAVPGLRVAGPRPAGRRERRRRDARLA
jgi:hypothetical protein